MSIEFFCPECGEPVRAVEKLAGLHTRCTNCLVNVPVPAAGSGPLPKRHRHGPHEGVSPLPAGDPAPAASPSPPPDAAAPKAAPAPPTAQATPVGPESKIITFRCPECRTRLTVHAELIGLHTHCLKCRSNILVPAVSEAEGWFGWVRKLFERPPLPPAAQGPSP
jgi:hypothetical protein